MQPMFLLALTTHLWVMENEIAAERRRRIEIEDTLRDVERECREPFVVPALLDAFAVISKLTSKALTDDVPYGHGSAQLG